MRTKITPIICSLAILTSCSVVKNTVETRPEMLSDQTSVWTVSGVEYNNGDFSGLCFTADGKRMVAAFNSAALYWLDIPETGDKELHFEPFNVEGAKYRETKRDIEAITLNKKSKDLYYVQERDGQFKGASIYKVLAPDYNKEELVVTFDKEIVPDGNNGLEGITWLGDDNFIAGREGGGYRKIAPLMIFYSESKGLIKTLTLPEEIKQIAEIVYDEVRDCLWILDGDYDKILFRCTLDGEVLDRYSIPEIKNAEALLLDRKRSCIWIGSDEEPSKLYKIAFKNL